MGLTTVNPMIKRDLPVTMEDFINHIDHIVKLVGVDFVGFGSDCLVRGWPTDPKDEGRVPGLLRRRLLQADLSLPLSRWAPRA